MIFIKNCKLKFQLMKIYQSKIWIHLKYLEWNLQHYANINKELIFSSL